VCSTHGITGRFDPDAWTSPRRTPPMYPDAITLGRDVPAETLLSRIDRSAGCSIKDSFASLDLVTDGFRVLFEAMWIYRPPGPPPDPGEIHWERVERPEDMRAWSADHGDESTFLPALLDERSVTFLAGRDLEGRPLAGAIATEGDAAVGISNVFVKGATDASGAAAALAATYASATAAIVQRFPGRPLVGYEAGAALIGAQAAGFQVIGPLRVWLREGS
jgi:hypothetical protein